MSLPSAATGQSYLVRYQQRKRAQTRAFHMLMRVPILATCPTRSADTFAGWERGHKVIVTTSVRYHNSKRALIDDLVVLNHIATETANTRNERLLTQSLVHIDPETFCTAHNTTPESLRDALRRLTSTMVEVANWGADALCCRAPFVEVEPYRAGYDVLLSRLLEGEITAGRFIKYPQLTSVPTGLEGRLFGWALGWVGPLVGDRRMVRQREALARVGTMPPGLDPWSEIRRIAAANLLPIFDLELVTFEEKPALAISRRPPWREQENIPQPEDPTKVIRLDEDWDVPAPKPAPRSVSIEPEDDAHASDGREGQASTLVRADRDAADEHRGSPLPSTDAFVIKPDLLGRLPSPPIWETSLDD